MKPVDLCIVVIALGWIFAREPMLQSIPRRLPIVDEAAQEPSLRDSRDALLRAAKAGDVTSVMQFVDPDIRATYWNKRGIEALKREWEIDASPKRFLDELVSALSLGGRFEDRERTSFIAPSFFIDYPDVTSMGSHDVVVRKGARVYSDPRDSSRVITQVAAGEVLPILVAFKGWVPGWLEVTLSGKRKGYMHNADLRSPSDTRAYFSKVGGRWMLTGFYGGVD